MQLKTIRYFLLLVGLMISLHASADVEVNATNFPDVVFRSWVLQHVAEGGVLTEEAISSVEYIRLDHELISSLQGIEHFTALVYLYCDHNQLTSLDVSKNTKLTSLYCNYNQLTNLNVSGCTALTSLDCKYNQLTNLNVSGCTALTSLDCNCNQLTNLNVSGCTALTSLDCSSNQLTSLDVSKNTALTRLSCHSNKLTSLDVSNNTALTSLSCDGNKLTSLDVSNNTALTSLSCYSNQLTSLDVSKNTKLTSLYCYSNQLTSLYVSKNTALAYLDCSSNQLTSLDVSNNTALKELRCSSNQLTGLDVSKNTALAYLYCYDNFLMAINLSNNSSVSYASINYQTISLAANATTEGFAIPVPSDFEIEKVSNLRLAETSMSGHLTTIDDQKYLVFAENGISESSLDRKLLSYIYDSGNGKVEALKVRVLITMTPISVEVNTKNFPDEGFRNWVIANIDGADDGVLTFDEITKVRRITINRGYSIAGTVVSSTYKFANLQGIEFFVSLTQLNCDANQLTNLDVSKNTALISLSCKYNQLKFLDVSGCTALTSLDCSSNQLTSLDMSKNIELTSLTCYSNQLTSLDVSGCTALTTLYCYSNNLTSLDVSKNTVLKLLQCYSNQISSIDLSTNTALSPSSYNPIKISPQSLSENAVNISSGVAIHVQPDFDYSKVSNLKLAGMNISGSVTTIDGLSYLVFSQKGTPESSYNWKQLSYSYDSGNSEAGLMDVTIVITTNLSSIEVNKDNFPDNAFRNWILLNVKGAKDSVLTGEEIAQVKSINCNYERIRSLEGIGHFVALTSLSCYSNQLTSLDVSKNTALTSLSCYSNQLTSLDVSKNTALKGLYCYSNQLTTLDVSKNTALTSLYCYSNQLTSLDVSKNTALTTLYCYSNQLTTLDVSNNTALTDLRCYSNQLTNLDVSKNTALTTLSCYSNQLTGLDVSNNTALKELSSDRNQLTSLDVSKNMVLTSLYCYSNKLTSLDVSKNTALTRLSCSGNKLTSLDVSNNTALTYLECSSNQLTTLDVSNNTALDYLSCSGNKLTSLDVSNNTALTYLDCDRNQLTSLDVSNNTALTYLDCSYNKLTSLDLSRCSLQQDIYYSPQIAAFQVEMIQEGLAIPIPIGFDMTKVSNVHIGGESISNCFVVEDYYQKYLVFGKIDDAEKYGNVSVLTYYYDSGNNSSPLMNVTIALTFTAFSNLSINAKTFPDETFRKWVIENVDGADDGVLTSEEIARTASILISSQNIKSLQGIEHFPALVYLSCSINQLTTLDVSKNTALTSLSCYSNQLTSLDVSKNTALTSLYCYSNQLTSLDVSKNTALTTLYCYSNQLTSLDVSNNTALTYLYCNNNQLTSLDVSKNTALRTLYCDRNQLTSLDVSKNTALSSLSCYSNQLTSLDVSKNTALKSLSCYYNQLTSLDLSKNTSISYYYSLIQSFSQKVMSISAGVAIPVTSEFDLTKVSDLKLAGEIVTGSITTENGQKYLVFAPIGTLENSYNWKLLSYNYDSGNSKVGLMGVRVLLTTASTSDVEINATNFPDEKFRNWIIDNISGANDYLLTAAEIAKISSMDCSNNGFTSLQGIEFFVGLTSLSCYSNQLTFLDVSKNTALTTLYCHSNKLMDLDLSKNTSISQYSISSQSLSLYASMISEGIAIPVNNSFDLSKVSDIKLDGTSVDGRIASVNGQVYLVFAKRGTTQNLIDGKNLTFAYDTDNRTVTKMDVSVALSYTALIYSLSIQSENGGAVICNDITVVNSTQSFTMEEGTTAVMTITPNTGFKLSKLIVNGTDVTSNVKDNQYTISNITANTTVVVTFKAIPQSITVDGINYVVASAADYTLNVGRGDYSGHVVIPATVSYDGDTWTVAGVVDGAFNLSAITAITWNPNTAIGDEAFGAQTNPNLLLYVKSEAYAPTNVQNVIANGRARKIVLTDAASGNDFNCPEAFTAEEISYTHRYGMTTGIGECRGWETIALPFDVKQFTHESKGTLIPFKVFSSTSAGKPFWLYRLTASGWQEAANIEANTPYIISLPNNKVYDNDYNLPGVMTFSSSNVTVPVTEVVRSTYGDRTFVANFTSQSSSWSIYALNVNNDYSTYSDYLPEGSTFIRELRTVHPFEAYMMNSSGNAKQFLPLFETLPTAIREIPMQAMRGMKGVRIYSMSGELIMFDQNISIEEALKQLKRGVYFVNGKKMVVK